MTAHHSIAGHSATHLHAIAGSLEACSHLHTMGGTAPSSPSIEASYGAEHFSTFSTT